MNEVKSQERLMKLMAAFDPDEAAGLGVTQWEIERLNEWVEFWELSAAQDRIVTDIERRVYGAKKP